MTLGVIFGNRDFFPDGLVAEARRDMLEVLGEMGVEPVVLTLEQTKLGAVETWQHALLCGTLLREAKQRIDGVLVCLPNFGDEKGIADALRLSELTCPILVQACPDDLDQFGLERRRDSFCGKISVCNNLRQYGMKYSLTRGPHGCDQIGTVQGRPRRVSGSMPRRERTAASEDRGNRRAAKCVQHDAL